MALLLSGNKTQRVFVIALTAEFRIIAIEGQSGFAWSRFQVLYWTRRYNVTAVTSRDSTYGIYLLYACTKWRWASRGFFAHWNPLLATSAVEYTKFTKLSSEPWEPLPKRPRYRQNVSSSYRITGVFSKLSKWNIVVLHNDS